MGGLLIMRWTNDGKSAPELVIPENCSIASFTQLEDAMNKWLDIVQYGLSQGLCGPEYYKETMLDYPNYTEDKCFFLVENGEAVATLTVVCDYEKKEGYIHMVACKETCRGKGYGTLLNALGIKTLKEEGMETAFLTTNDWRVPAIKSYLRAGFVPDMSTDDYKERWKIIFENI